MTQDSSMLEEFKTAGHGTLPAAIVSGVPIIGFHNDWSNCTNRVKELLGFQDEEPEDYDGELE